MSKLRQREYIFSSSLSPPSSIQVLNGLHGAYTPIPRRAICFTQSVDSNADIPHTHTHTHKVMFN